METNANNSYSDEIEIDLGEVFMLMWHYLWLILLSIVVAGVVGFLVSKFAITPLYKSSTAVYILNNNNNNAALTYSDLQMGSQLTKDYAEMIKSRSVLEKVIENLKLEEVETYGSLAKRVEVTTQSDTRILIIKVTDASPEWAQSLADDIRNVASERITSVMDIEAVNVVDYADLPTSPASPSIKKWAAIGGVIGAFLSIAFILIRFLMDDTIKTSEDVEKFLNMSTLAMIPLMNEMEGQKEKERQEKLQLSNEEDERRHMTRQGYEKTEFYNHDMEIEELGQAADSMNGKTVGETIVPDLQEETSVGSGGQGTGDRNSQDSQNTNDKNAPNGSSRSNVQGQTSSEGRSGGHISSRSNGKKR